MGGYNTLHAAPEGERLSVKNKIMSKVSAYFHIVFCTKGRRMSLPLEHCEDLYRFIWKDITNLNCRLLRIDGIQNHVHMLINMHQNISLKTLMQEIKRHSSSWMHSDARFTNFDAWAVGYFAASVSPSHKEYVVEYIKNQRQHHLSSPFDTEITKLYAEASIPYDDRDLR